MCRLKNKNVNLKQRVIGFTLIEMIVVLLVGALLLAWGVPNYRDFKVRKEVSLVVNEAVYSFNLARAEAIRYGADVQVRVNGGGWEDGWEIWSLDADGNDNQQLFEQQALSDISMSQTGGLAGRLQFNRLGALVDGAVSFEADNDNPVADSLRNIQISPSGSVRVVTP